MSESTPAPLTSLACIAVDDEPLALGLVCAFIEQTPFLHLAGRYPSALAALKALHEHPEVKLLFLDIHMPDLSGLELARVLQGNGQRVVFTTAYNHYALEGFRVDALDYLLKPFDYEEFLRVALKARAVLMPSSLSVGTTLPAPEGYIYLKVEYQLVRVQLADILYVEGLKDYVKVHLASAGRPLLSLTSLRSMEEKLPADKFMRVHRSFIVGLDHVAAVGRGTLQVGKESLPVSDSYREVVDKLFSRWK
jgi:DNA-binding LytR/AlgR family response regulator